MAPAEFTSLPLTIAILVLAFGALVAAGLPVLLASPPCSPRPGSTRSSATSCRRTNRRSARSSFMIGMAVGIDYSLFYLRREREERYGGATPHDALMTAARTSGQAVLSPARPC